MNEAVYQAWKQGLISEDQLNVLDRRIRTIETQVERGTINPATGIERLERLRKDGPTPSAPPKRSEKGSAEGLPPIAPPSPAAPSEVPANSSAPGSGEKVVSFAARKRAAEPSPVRQIEVTPPEHRADGKVSPGAAGEPPIAVPKASASSSPLKEQQNRDIRKRAVWRDCLEGRITDAEAEQQVAAIDAAPPEACASA